MSSAGVGRDLVFDAAVVQRKAETPTLLAMRDLVRNEASRIEAVQAGLIDAGMRSGPDAGQIRKLVVWDALERVMELFIRHEARARTFFRDLEAQGER